MPSKIPRIKIYRTNILPASCTGVKLESLVFREERMVFKKRVLRRISGSKGDKLTGG
jgi:hypothetical protein